ncbi:hypothetical protein SB773_14220 [Bacillus sp. SIMBA_074]|uniref:hypothetical protein n=1 Tax=Bacillus sp. SIMBA_074 TaxID=3085812 RepID=UPI00397D3567
MTFQSPLHILYLFFTEDLIQLRGNIMFGATPERSAENLVKLVEKASVHPNLAKQVQEEYLSLGAAIAQRVGNTEQGLIYATLY